MNVRTFTEDGMIAFREHLQKCDDKGKYSVPEKLLYDKRSTRLFSVDVELELIKFETRYQAGKYFNELFSSIDHRDVQGNAGLWTWIAAVYGEQLAIVDKNGTESMGEDARWILDPYNDRRYYRHLLHGPYVIVRAHTDKVKITRVVLRGELNKPGEVAAQLTASKDIITNQALLELAESLYLKSDGTIRRGAAGAGSGSSRRLSAVLNQLNLTYDLYSMESDDIGKLLPFEFKEAWNI